MQATLRIAQNLAAAGLPVFPCGRQKQPAIGKKNGGRGFLDATAAKEEVERLFWRAPRAPLVGVPTGEASGFDVLDIDYRHGGGDWEAANQLPETRIHSTLSGGRHYLFLHVAGVRNSASKFSLAPGVDIRGDGGYIIHPPSPGYGVVSDAPIAEWPDWLLKLVLARPEKTSAPLPASQDPISTTRADRYCEAIIRRIGTAPEGGKHFALRNAAILIGGLLHLTTWTPDQATRRLVEALPASVQDWDNARATASWGIEQGSRRPIDTIADRPDWQPRQPSARVNGQAGPHITSPEPPIEQPRLPVIRVYKGLRHIAADHGLDALAAAGVPFYQRDRQLVRPALSKAKTADSRVVEVPSLLAITMPILARALGQSAEWERVTKDGEPIRIDPPNEVVEQIAAMAGEWPFPPVAGVIGTPTMRPDGSLLTQAGYDEATGLVLMSPPQMLPLPAAPTRGHAEAALVRLKSLLSEFPFADDASQAVGLSMLMTPVLRGALGSAVPMHVVNAPQPGTGKSYLQDLASVLATGERCAVITVSPDPNETEKRLVGAALASFPIVALDNCNGVLAGDFLAQVTERPLLQLRPLGTSGVIRIANTFTVFANGNNIAVSADLVRRTIMGTLDANMERPETREFTHDPVAEISENRGAFLRDCLIIARAYHCAGYPDELPRMASFERWSNLVRSALVWLGCADPAGNLEAIRADDPVRTERSAVFQGWAGALDMGVGYTAAEIIQRAEEFADNGYVHAAFRDALLGVAKAKGADRIDGKRLGWWLRGTAQVITGGFKMMKDNHNPSHILWSLQRV